MSWTRLTSLCVIFAFSILGGFAWAGLKGSAHDFGDKEWSGGDACGVCHGLDRDEPPTAAPLWDANADLNRRFGTPLSGEAHAGDGTLICLRCHDGTVAIDTVSEQAKEHFTNKGNAGMFTTGHQTSNHPVGVEYPQFDKHYRPMTTVIAKGTVLLPDGKVECTSCHDPHNDSGLDNMLLTSNIRSALCLTCHKK